ncbi:hypothetical protein JHK82_049813 [Glycine max]|nr:hypothetical protein JHK82_049813 [Glycine max]KAG5094135.1 hypothetical protein JHK84_049723 [Glycine max]
MAANVLPTIEASTKWPFMQSKKQLGAYISQTKLRRISIGDFGAILLFSSQNCFPVAVICLDGDGCKVRNGLATIEGDSDLDTSIAWFCFRCVVDEVSKGTSNSVERTTMECNADNHNSNSECHAEDSFSGKVSVSVADTGETAVVVSMVDQTIWVPATSEKSLLPFEVGGYPMTESCILMSDTNGQQSGEVKTGTNTLQIMEEEELELSLSNNISCSVTSKSLVHNDLKKSVRGARDDPSGFDGTKLFDESLTKTSPSRIESEMGLQLGLSSTLGLWETIDHIGGFKAFIPVFKPYNVDDKIISGDEIEANACKDNARVAGGKRKHADYK